MYGATSDDCLRVMTETRLVEDPVKAWPEISKYCFLQKFSKSIVLDEVPFLLHEPRESFKTCRCVSEEEQARLPSLQVATPAKSTVTLGPERPETHATTIMTHDACSQMQYNSTDCSRSEVGYRTCADMPRDSM